MGVPTSEVGYTSATTGRGYHEVHKGHVVALGEGELCEGSKQQNHNVHMGQVMLSL
jgi:co-chaperonin GroES (HSP10)